MKWPILRLVAWLEGEIDYVEVPKLRGEIDYVEVKSIIDHRLTIFYNTRQFF